MKHGYCKFIGCPRLVSYQTTSYGVTVNHNECNQQEPDGPVWWKDCRAVSRHDCQRLRGQLKEQREVQV